VATTNFDLLYRLAALYGVETGFYDFGGSFRPAAPQSLLAVLRALGALVEKPAGIADAFRERVQELWRRWSEPVAVAWGGKAPSLVLRQPAGTTGLAGFRIVLECGGTMNWVKDWSRLPLLRTVTVEGERYEARKFTLPVQLPLGYHQLTLNLPSGSQKMLIISTPHRAYQASPGPAGRSWGVFLPLYALCSKQSWGIGQLSDLKALLRWVHQLGGNIAGTLPLLAAFLEEPFAPSPYEPVSRLFWNELYLDVTQVEELKRSPEAREVFDLPAFQEEINMLRAVPWVDYRRAMAAKRRILEPCAHLFFAEDSHRQAEHRRWTEQNPAVHDYARFRAAVEHWRSGWTEWPVQMRNGILRAGDYEPENERYHLYVQWLAHLQFQELDLEARCNGVRLYLDLPLGVHRGGYDVWRERAAFALDASAGAPPDALFVGGQDWGFPPLHPERIREQGYRYFIACLRHHLRHAGALRLDHVMGLHRLFWVPAGLTAREGVYVHYRADEFYAILTLESFRHRTMLIGEDLGTVPGYVRKDMARHNISRMYVLSFEYTGERSAPLRPVPARALVTLNTHDMPPFAAYWQGKKGDSGEKVDLPPFLYRQGWLPELTDRTQAVLHASLSYLAASPARLLLVNLEDLWLEKVPQNVPGTTDENPNWQRKARYSLEEFSVMPAVVDILQQINRLRHT